MHHFQDPCRHCGTPLDKMEFGPCKGDPAKAVPLAYAVIPERRFDGVEHYRVRFSDGRVVDRWEHVSFHAPYYHFGYSDDLIQPPRHDLKLRGQQPTARN